jgi:hypothetical protein
VTCCAFGSVTLPTVGGSWPEPLSSNRRPATRSASS